jgi:hypothetical protein
MNDHSPRAKLGWMAAFCGLLFGSAPWPRQDPRLVPYLPLVYEVRFAPTPVKGDGEYHLIYELHLANFSRREVTLRKIEVLEAGKSVVKAYEKDRLLECLTRPGKPRDIENKLTLEGGARAVLFIMVSFRMKAETPDSLTHRVTAECLRGTGEKEVLCGEGAQVSVAHGEPRIIGPPVRPGVWLAGNCPGDGPVGHRLSLQPWNGRLVVNQRYAVDFMKFSQDYKLVQGDSSKNASWYGYSEQVIAVADGVVSDCKDGIIENTPNKEYAVPNNLESAAGNYVILSLSRRLYAVYAHLKPGSLRVKVGAHVRKGQALGLVGNSGISDAPHLHFHLIDSDSVFGGEGLPFVFERFELLGPFEQLDDRLDKTWSPSGRSTARTLEMPMGDVVIRFPGLH